MAPPPSQRFIARRAALVNTGPGGAEVGLLGSLLMSVRVSLLQAPTPSAISAAMPERRSILKVIMERSSGDRKSTRLNSSHGYISYAVFCLKKKRARGC